MDNNNKICRILSLDGGGAKGFYTLGVLRGIEALVKRPLCECFDLIFGTSTGAIIAALIALGHEVKDIHELYKTHVPTIMKRITKRGRSEALADLANTVFGDKKFDEVKTGIGIVATRWLQECPMIFKGGSIAKAHGNSYGTFAPGFGVPISEAVQASCSAYPLFRRKTVTTLDGDKIELMDGGYCANNPTLYAIADASNALKIPHNSLRVISIGVGVYPKPSNLKHHICKLIPGVQWLEKALEINTQSMEQLRHILYKDIPTIRINQTFERPEMATDFMEYDLNRLNILRQRGGDSYAVHEQQLKSYLL